MAVNLIHTKHFKLSKTLGEAIRYMAPGEPLPTIEELKEKYRVSQVTISQALERLRAQGLVERPFGRKRLVVAQVGARPLFRVTLIRPLWSSPDYDTITNAIYTLGQEQHFGFHLHIFHSVEDLNVEEALRNADAGLIIGDRVMSREQVEAFNRSRKPVVFLRDKPDAVKADSIWVNDLAVGKMATKHLLDLGHKRIVAMLSEPPNPSSTQRLRGWSEAMRQKGLKHGPELIADCSVRPGKDAIQGSYERFSAWLDTNREPFTAIFCTAWTGALAVLRALHDRRIPVPGKVSLVTFDSESAISSFLTPPLTTVSIDVEQYALEAVQLLQRSLEGQERGKPRALQVTPRLVVRESTRALKG